MPLGLGVSFFYVLSGFILTYVYRDMSNHSVRRYYLTRIARLWPTHIVTLLAAAVFIPSTDQVTNWYLALTANLLLVHSWIPIWGYPFSFNSVSWSLSVEVAFYIVFPLLATTRHFRWWYLGIVALVFGSLAYVSQFGIAETETLGEWSVRAFVNQSPIIRILEFTTGVAFGRFYLHRKIACGDRSEMLAICAIILFGMTAKPIRDLIGGPFGQWYFQCGALFIFAATIYIIANSSGPVSRFLSKPILGTLGEISFATYMVHQIIITMFIDAQVYVWLGKPLTAALCLLLIYGASYLLWRFVEVPGRHLARHLGHPAPRIDPAMSRDVIR